MERQTKYTYIFLLIYVAASILHNLLFAVAKIEESVLMIIGLLAILLFFLSILYNVFTHLRLGKPRDIWKLGWIGILGFLGFMPGFGAGFFGLYGFYGFFGFKHLHAQARKK